MGRRWQHNREKRRGWAETLSSREFGSKHCLLLCIIVAQQGALFLLLKLLSGKVRLTGLREQEVTGKGDKQQNRGRGKDGREEGDWPG